MLRHFRYRLARELRLTVRTTANDDVELAEVRIFLGIVVAEMSTAALLSLERKESRSGHFRDDYPEKDPNFGKFNIVIRRGPNGEAQLSRETIPEMPEHLKRVIEENK